MSKHYQRFLSALILCSTFGTANAVSANLLVNGSFEEPYIGYQTIGGGNSLAITGWTTILNGVEIFDATSYGGAADGKVVIDLANYTYTGGGIEQTFATTAGQQYDLTFWLGNLLASGRDGTGVVKVSVAGGNYIFNTPAATTALLTWEKQQLSFTAQGASTTLSFSNDQNANLHFANVDAVSVTAVPEPETYAMLLAGLGLMGGVARRNKRK